MMKPPEFLQQRQQQIELALSAMMQKRQTRIPQTLWKAMHYSLMAGGKRIRPALMLEVYQACGGKGDIMPVAMSVECMHSYSLIHDDLPCMDDDHLRRGIPTCHVAFDEATAVLAGDSLHTLSFELLSEMTVDKDLTPSLVQKMAVAAGAQGMGGGQVLDIEAEGRVDLDLLDVERIHIHKTGMLLRYCCEAGALLAKAEPEVAHACARYGEAVGLLFQIADDILDATATDAELGKSAGKDQAQEKSTYVSILGIEQAQEKLQEMLEIALEALEPLEEKAAQPLVLLANYIVSRKT
ncbi:MAG: polyprenyl synthetase family protein [Mariprofundaceae bacterium]|nr:polyprenyl synthetase family protein [Mariprofundaceae bacterium]